MNSSGVEGGCGPYLLIFVSIIKRDDVKLPKAANQGQKETPFVYEFLKFLQHKGRYFVPSFVPL